MSKKPDELKQTPKELTDKIVRSINSKITKMAEIAELVKKDAESINKKDKDEAK